jgi:FecR protein
MRAMLRWWWWCTLATALVAVPAGHAWAQGTGVQFIAAVGDVRIVGRDGTQRAAARGAELREGETILTGANGLAQLRLADGGMISVRGETELKLDRFAYRGKDDRSASFLVSLLKGGFRSVTGLIGQLNRDGYKVNTPFATIGIRGTVHNPFVQLPAPPGQQTLVAPGAYDYVEQGAIAMQTLQGQTLSIGAQQTGFVSLAGVPQLLPTVPPIFQRGVVRPPPPQTDPRRAPKTSDSTAPGTMRQIDPATRAAPTSPLQTAPSPTLQAPTAIPPTPATIQPAPSTTIQTAPIQTSPLQTSPLQTSPLQTSPMMKPGPVSPAMTSK